MKTLFLICSLLSFSSVFTYKEKTVELGSSQFSDVVQSSAFVDKTGLLRALFDARYVLLTAPSRFGKSTNLDMIKTFLSLPGGERPANRNLTEGHAIFKNLAIYGDRAFFYEHFSAYPVIHLNLKVDNQRITNYRQAFAILLDKTHESFKEHRYLLNSSRLTAGQRELCCLWVEPLQYERLSELRMGKGPADLAEFLHLHHNKKVFVLIDEYDSIVANAMLGVGDEELEEIVTLILGQISALCKGSDHVGNGLITGVSNIAGGRFANLNDFAVHDYLDDHPLANLHGFREAEVDGLFRNPLFRLDRGKVNEARLWYSGYVSERSERVYCPFSVLNFLNSGGAIRNYWADLGHIKNLKAMFDRPSVMIRIKELLAFNNVSIRIYDRMELDSLIALRNMYWATDEVPNYDLLFSHFLELGYLTRLPKADDMGSDTAVVKLPNLEVWDSVLSKLTEAYKYKEDGYLDGVLLYIAEGARKTFKSIDVVEAINRHSYYKLSGEHFKRNAFSRFVNRITQKLFSVSWF